MIASTHLAVGAASSIIGQKYIQTHWSKKYWLGIAVAMGLMSHIVLDAFPHWEYQKEWPWLLVIVETLIVFCFILSPKNKPIVNLILFCGMLGGAFPDLLSRIPLNLALSANNFIHLYHESLPIPVATLYVQIFLALIGILFVKLKLSEPNLI